MARILVLNSYADPPPPLSEILYPPLGPAGSEWKTSDIKAVQTRPVKKRKKSHHKHWHLESIDALYV